MKPSQIRPAVAAAFLLALIAIVPIPSAWAGGSPGQAVVNGQKALVLVSRDPPGARCNNNIQVAAELSNIYKIPVQIIPVTFAGPGAKAPAVYYGGQLIAVDGGELNGMVSYDQIADILEIENAPKQAQQGRLMEVKKDFDTLKSAIKSGN
ncbi:MAG: hypothetical protein M1449_13010 [Candidatus Thermoplasmatota archaeon]|nr:hypothetical protein [Candidatus Thermoplasmatota archaeon]MCL5061290.1 hypothetical protein [Candidatus Thermoplasmatota archaeon]